MIWSLLNNPALLVYRLVAVVVALSFHEWGHAFVAYKLGDPTARNLGRMTLDPMKHLDLFGFISMMIAGFGWAKPVPINPGNFKNYQRGSILVALGGVLVNFLLAFVAVFILVGLTFKTTIALGSAKFILDFLSTFMAINLGLLVFNLIPIPPLDGYQALKNLLIGKVRNLNIFWTLEQYGFMILLLLLVGGVITPILQAGVSGLFNMMFSVAGAVFGVPTALLR